MGNATASSSNCCTSPFVTPLSLYAHLPVKDVRLRDDAAEELACWKRGQEASAKVAAAAAAAKVKHDDEAAQRAKEAVAKQRDKAAQRAKEAAAAVVARAAEVKQRDEAAQRAEGEATAAMACLLYTSPSPRDS